jgi:hypothetical protein
MELTPSLHRKGRNNFHSDCGLPVSPKKETA